MERVAIVGVGQSVHRRSRPDADKAELVLEAIDEALADAGVGLGDLDNAITASLDFWDGRTIANMAVAEVVGSYLKSESRVCGDAISALAYAWSRYADGAFRMGMVAAHCKESEGNLHDIENAAFDPFTQRRLDPDGDVVAALTARAFYEQTRYTPEDAAAAVVAARRASRSNPKVEDLEEVTVEDVLAAPALATPLTALEKAPASDGSCVLIIASETAARDLSGSPVWIEGLATMTGRFWSDRDLLDVSALEEAARRATTMAGWGGAQPDFVELSAQFSFQVLQFAEALGAGNGSAPPLNPSGGWLAGNPITVTGLSRVAEAVHQIRGTAGDRQLPGVERALAHGTTGLGAQSHAVVALGAGG